MGWMVLTQGTLFLLAHRQLPSSELIRQHIKFLYLAPIASWSSSATACRFAASHGAPLLGLHPPSWYPLPRLPSRHRCAQIFDVSGSFRSGGKYISSVTQSTLHIFLENITIHSRKLLDYNKLGLYCHIRFTNDYILIESILENFKLGVYCYISFTT